MKEINDLESLLIADDATETALSIAKEELAKELERKNEEEIRQEKIKKIKKMILEEFGRVSLILIGVIGGVLFMTTGPSITIPVSIVLSLGILVGTEVQDYKKRTKKLKKMSDAFDALINADKIGCLQALVKEAEEKLNSEKKSKRDFLESNKEIKNPDLTSSKEETKSYTKTK